MALKFESLLNQIMLNLKSNWLMLVNNKDIVTKKDYRIHILLPNHTSLQVALRYWCRLLAVK